jgi:tetratricopeptide (TPR) repeat protein
MQAAHSRSPRGQNSPILRTKWDILFLCYRRGRQIHQRLPRVMSDIFHMRRLPPNAFRLTLPMPQGLSMLLIVAIAISGGCSADKNRGGQQQSGSSNPLHANPSEFDVAKDPPITAETRFAAGQFAESQGRLDVAIEQYGEALKINPKNENSLYRLGVLYTQVKDYTKAIETWKRYVTVTAGTATAYSNLGFCLELAGKLPDAEQAFRNGIKTDPSNRACRVNYGRMLARAGRDSEAAQQFSAVLKPSDAHYNLGAVYEQLGRTTAAKAEYRQAIDADPTNTEAQARLSMLGTD